MKKNFTSTTRSAEQPPPVPANLRQRAEAAFLEKAATAPEILTPLTPALSHEWQVHQIELEMQNEELRHSQLELEAARTRYCKFFDLAPVGFCTVSEKGIINEANLTLATLLGVARSALVGQRFSSLILQEDRERFNRLRQPIPAAGGAQNCDLRLVKSGGSHCRVNVTATVDTSPKGEASLRVIVTDLTAGRQAESALQESEERLKFALEATLDGLWDWDIPSGTVHFSPQWARLLGYAPGEIQERVESFYTLVHPDDVALVKQAMEDHFAGRSPVKQGEIRLRTKSGEYRWFLDRGKVVVRNAAGEPVRMVGTISDITDRKQTEDQLRTSERRLKDAQACAHIGNFHWDARTNRVVWSDELYRIYGRTLGEFEPSFESYVAAIHPEDRPQVVETLRGAMGAQGAFAHDYRLVLPAGEVIWVHARGSALTDGAGHFCGLEGTCQDITARKQAILALENEGEFLAAVFENVTDGILVCDAHRVLTMANRAMREMHGYPTVGMPTGHWSEYFELRHAGSSRPLTNEETPLYHALHEGSVHDVELTITPKGRPVRQALVNGQAFHAVDGRVLGALIVVRDITARKQAEEQLRQLNAELGQRVAERTAELEQANRELDAFSHSVSHDLRAPLRAVSGFGEFLEENYAATLDERGRGFLRHMTTGAAQMSRLVEDLLQFAHASRRELRRQRMDLSALAEEVVGELRNAAPQRSVRFVCAPGLTVSGDPRLLRVVLVNLLGNAWKYTSKATMPRVELGQSAGAGEPTFFVRDNGAGFDMHYADRLFGAFQRLHSMAEFEGSGVGLATVQRIIHRHGGKIWAEARVNAGATFHFTLPDQPVPSAPARTLDDLQPAGSPQLPSVPDLPL